MSITPSAEIREVAMAVASATEEAAKLVENDSSDSCEVKDDLGRFIPEGKLSLSMVFLQMPR